MRKAMRSLAVIAIATAGLIALGVASAGTALASPDTTLYKGFVCNYQYSGHCLYATSPVSVPVILPSTTNWEQVSEGTWTFGPVTRNVWEFRQVDTDKCMQYNSDNGKVDMATCDASKPSEIWAAPESPTEGWYVLINKYATELAGEDACLYDDDALAEVVTPCVYDAQMWNFTS
jgi:hypothetical protein